MNPKVKESLDSLETNAMLRSRIAEIAVSKCLEGFDSNDLGDSEIECIKSYTAKALQTTIYTDLYRYADKGRPAYEA
jgi:hypothetical protein